MKCSLGKVRICVSFRTNNELECWTWGKESHQSQEAALSQGNEYDLGAKVANYLSLGVKSEHPCREFERIQILKE